MNTTILALTTGGLLVTAAIILARGVIGPTIFDRLQAASSIGTVAMLLLSVFGFLNGRPELPAPHRSGATLPKLKGPLPIAVNKLSNAGLFELLDT